MRAFLSIDYDRRFNSEAYTLHKTETRPRSKVGSRLTLWQKGVSIHTTSAYRLEAISLFSFVYCVVFVRLFCTLIYFFSFGLCSECFHTECKYYSTSFFSEQGDFFLSFRTILHQFVRIIKQQHGGSYIQTKTANFIPPFLSFLDKGSTY